MARRSNDVGGMPTQCAKSLENWSQSPPMVRATLVLTLLCMTVVSSTSCTRDQPSPISSALASKANTPTSSSSTGQRRSDRVVGYWTSSNGDAVILAYSGSAPTFWIQVYPKPKRSDPRHDYTANWMSDDEFWFLDSSGRRVSGRVETSDKTIVVTDSAGLQTTWTRKH